MTERKSLSETLHDRLHDKHKPDQYTIAWWKRCLDELTQQIRGLSHSVNLAVANGRDYWDEIKKEREVNRLLKTELEQANSVIGELSGTLTMLSERVDKLGERVDKMSDWIHQQRTKK